MLNHLLWEDNGDFHPSSSVPVRDLVLEAWGCVLGQTLGRNQISGHTKYRIEWGIFALIFKDVNRT